MNIENTIEKLDKVKLISELQEIHKSLFEVYKNLFAFKYETEEDFKLFTDKEYKENGIGSKDKKAWNDNFCHRASYTQLNKILFVRICEDKGFMLNSDDYIAGEVIDPHIGEKLSKIGLQKWKRLITNYTFGELIKFAFCDMKKSYINIILYKEDKYEILNPKDEDYNIKNVKGDNDAKKLILDFENVLSDIIDKLDTNNFNFKYADGNILGDVYEKFMDRETRKSIGQFYTPEFVIEYILKNTVQEADVVENPFITVADISCGSGHFLIMAYDILRKKFISNIKKLRDKYVDEVYTIKKNGKEEQLSGREYWVKENIHYHILKHCIYGADIDSFAVQLTTINLLLKDLDNFTDELNIIECDSLIKQEVDYDWKWLNEQLEEEYETVTTTQINLFGDEEKFEKKVIKANYNLKYIDISGIQREALVSREKAEEIIVVCEFWSNKFDYIVGNPPYLLCQDGNVQDALVNYYKNKYSVAQYKIDLFHLFFNRGLDLLQFNGSLSFISPNTYLTNIYLDKLREKIIFESNIERISLINKEVFCDVSVDTCIINFTKKEMNEDIQIYDYKSNEFVFSKYISQSDLKNQDKFIINVNKSNKFEVHNFKKLGDICEICFGLQTKDKNKYVSKNKKNMYWDKCITGKNIGKFLLKYDNLYFYNKRDEVKAGGCWNEDLHKTQKIVVRQIGNPEPVCAYDEKGYFSLNTIYNIISRDDKFNIKYILGILNSEFMKEFWLERFYDNKNIFPKVKKIQLEQIPIKISDNKIQEEVAEIVNDITKYKELLSKIDFIAIFQQKSTIYYMYEYLKVICEEIFIESYVNCLISELNILIYNIYEVEFNNNLKQKIDENAENLYKYIEDQKQLGIAIDELAVKYNKSKEQIICIINDYFSKIKTIDSFDQYINKCLRKHALNYMKKEIYDYYTHSNEIKQIEDIESYLKKKINNFDIILEIIRNEEITKKSMYIIKEALNSDAYTWNAYRKDIAQDKVSKTFVKYYDSNYYGLTEWPDEIHKQYFMDVIQEYTENNPNVKKAKDISKLFEDLNIEDKKDYIYVIEEKIKKAFS